MKEELNKYLSYVRNLGFEDTPDYDYLRDLFTQALKNTGEVEDGEYDWMKLNNGKGWEAMKQHPSQVHHHAANAVPNSSARALGGGMETPRGPKPPGVTVDRLNAAQPPPPSPAKPGVGKTRDRLGASGAVPIKRQSGAGGLTDVVTPTASTQAQFQSSTANLGNRMSTAPPGMSPQGQQMPKQQNSDPQKLSFFQKLMKSLCCGR
jgi:casein kinase 1